MNRTLPYDPPTRRIHWVSQEAVESLSFATGKPIEFGECERGAANPGIGAGTGSGAVRIGGGATWRADVTSSGTPTPPAGMAARSSRRAWCISRMLRYRSAGFLAIERATIWLSRASNGPDSCQRGGGDEACAASTCAVVPWKGGRPVSISTSMQPSEY